MIKTQQCPHNLRESDGREGQIGAKKNLSEIPRKAQRNINKAGDKVINKIGSVTEKRRW